MSNEPPQSFRVGDRVRKSPAGWRPSDFDRWGSGIGIGEVVAVDEDGLVDVRWPAGRSMHHREELCLATATKGLPPGPWLCMMNGDGSINSVVDAGMHNVIGLSDRAYAHPRIIRAIEGLPELVEAARKVLKAATGNEWWLMDSLGELRDALVTIDGEGRSDG